MLRWIFALLLIPFLDAVILAIVVSQTTYIGWVGMVLLVVLTGLVGMLLVRAEGRRTIRKMQRSMAQGKPPTNELLDGGLLIAAGAFLLTPGLVTDIIGFLLVVPLTRLPIRAALKRFVIVPYADKKTGGFASGKVWTFGFPDEGMARESSQASPADGGTYDLGADDYSVDANNSEESYTIDFGNESTTDELDDDTDDPSAR
ncbi:FxsA family protein [Natronorubrum bangense]|uniref:Phage T7 F exclusion suppressor FxsA n=2 Tax=Natronorubrum bangense TaxID=61858 RepID=L9WPC9_9EURY|nr:FxsA family protein [Natronorubrum bangense]ELY51046.1 phage T7 F exclusion suppressor FxsA [Natronorubrum bangense JCM 10635]QCC54532.1 membrane protein FxsA [Natronorubrum bangense]